MRQDTDPLQELLDPLYAYCKANNLPLVCVVSDDFHHTHHAVYNKRLGREVNPVVLILLVIYRAFKTLQDAGAKFEETKLFLKCLMDCAAKLAFEVYPRECRLYERPPWSSDECGASSHETLFEGLPKGEMTQDERPTTQRS